MRRSLFRICLLGLFILGSAAGCATLDPNYEEPVVTLASLRAVPSAGMTPEFEAVLRITNPNSEPLDIQGVVYTISLQGYDVVKSVGKGFEPIDAYSEGTVTVRGSVSLLQGVRLFADLVESHGQTLDYEFKAKLDLSGLNPTVRISETGSLNLGAAR
jgi:LEA14-like dessication related protein